MRQAAGSSASTLARPNRQDPTANTDPIHQFNERGFQSQTNRREAGKGVFGTGHGNRFR